MILTCKDAPWIVFGRSCRIMLGSAWGRFGVLPGAYVGSSWDSLRVVRNSFQVPVGSLLGVIFKPFSGRYKNHSEQCYATGS